MAGWSEVQRGFVQKKRRQGGMMRFLPLSYYMLAKKIGSFLTCTLPVWFFILPILLDFYV